MSVFVRGVRHGEKNILLNKRVLKFSLAEEQLFRKFPFNEWVGLHFSATLSDAGKEALNGS